MNKFMKSTFEVKPIIEENSTQLAGDIYKYFSHDNTYCAQNESEVEVSVKQNLFCFLALYGWHKDDIRRSLQHLRLEITKIG